jgi:hypothetical protein
MSLTEALIINALVLFAVLEADLGPHRTVGAFRVLRPLLLAGAILPIFARNPATHGDGLTLEIAGVAIGVLGGLCASVLMRVYRSPQTDGPVSRAGWGYVALWVVVIGLRSAFSYGAQHWFRSDLGRWMETHHVTSDALVDALLLMAVAMTLTRTAFLTGRAVRVMRLSPVAARL